MLVIKVENLKELQSATIRLQQFLSERNIQKDSVFDCKLVLSELVSNVLKHTNGVATVTVGVLDGAVEIKISSEMPFTPPIKSVCSDVYAENGRGLFLIDSVCETRSTTEDGSVLVTVKIK